MEVWCVTLLLKINNSDCRTAPLSGNPASLKCSEKKRWWQKMATSHNSAGDKSFPFKWQRRGTVCFSDITLILFRVALLSSTLRLLVCVPASWSVSSAGDSGFPSKKREMTCWKKKISAPWCCAGTVNGGVAASHPLIKQQLRPSLIPLRAEDATLALVPKDRTDRNFAQGGRTIKLGPN